MKIFVVDRALDRWDGAWERALEADAAPRPDILPLTMGADSALVRPGFPCFLPDFAREGWEIRLAPMVRVGKLGKWIEPRFADRYIDALAVGAILRPAGDGNSAAARFLPVFDGAIMPGSFLPLPSGEEAVLQYGKTADGAPLQLTFPLSALRISETLALISRSTTVKSGDLLVPAIFPAPFPAEIGLDISASILRPGEAAPERPRLRTRVK